jgi:hypothetical protein
MPKTETPTFNPDDEKSAREAAEAQFAAEGVLDPQGDERRHKLARKAEELIAQAQKLLEQLDIAVADPDAIRVENEVRQALNELNEVYVSNQQSDYAYAWVYRDPHNEFGGRHVRRMQALGWEVVSGDMPEAREHRFVDGTRVVADCLLMRIRIDRKLVLDKRDRLLREAQQAGIVSRVADLADRAGTRLYDKLPGFVEEAIATNAAQRRARALRDFHRLNQDGKLDRMMKTGTIPGVPAPGAGVRK